MPTIDITVTKRSDDYHAALADNSGVWESGRTQAEAIGKLVISAGGMLGIAVHTEKKAKRK